MGSQQGDNANSFVLPSYTRLDGGVRWQLDRKTVLNLGIRNLTDENCVATGGANDFLVTGRDRTVLFDMKYSF